MNNVSALLTMLVKGVFVNRSSKKTIAAVMANVNTKHKAEIDGPRGG